MHAVSRDTTLFPSPCVYVQIDAQHRVGTTVATNGAMPMEVSSGTGGDDADEGDEDGDDAAEEDEETQEIRLVPIVEVDGDGMDQALDALFKALSECAALNPDDDEDDEDDDDGYVGPHDGGDDFDENAVIGFDGTIDPSDLMANATPAQLAMLEKYDAMLDTSNLETGTAALQVVNCDGRFDDADDDDGGEVPVSHGHATA